MEYFVISAKFVPLKYYTLSSQLQRLTSFSVGCSGRRILSPGQIAVMRKWSIQVYLSIENVTFHSNPNTVWHTGCINMNSSLFVCFCFYVLNNVKQMNLSPSLACKLLNINITISYIHTVCRLISLGHDHVTCMYFNKFWDKILLRKQK